LEYAGINSVAELRQQIFLLEIKKSSLMLKGK